MIDFPGIEYTPNAQFAGGAVGQGEGSVEVAVDQGQGVGQ